MIKNSINMLILAFLLISTFNIFLKTDNVKADNFYYYDFESSVLTHQVNCGETFFYTTKVNGFCAVTDNETNSGDRSYELDPSDGISKIYINICENNQLLMTNFSSWIYTTSSSEMIHFQFINSTSETTLIDIKIESEDYKFKDYGGTYTTLNESDQMKVDEWNYFRWYWVNNQTVNYSMTNYNGNTWSFTDTPANITDDNYVIDFIVINTNTAGVFYLDDIIVGYDYGFDDDYYYAYPTVVNADVFTQTFKGVLPVHVGAIIRYDVIINGSDGCKAIITIRDSTGNYIFDRILLKGTNTFWVNYPLDSPFGTYQMRIFDTNLLSDTWNGMFEEFYVYSLINQQENYTSLYGDAFIEFMYNDIECYYGLNDHPSIIYRLSQDDPSDGTYMYFYDIIHNEKIVYTGQIKATVPTPDYIFNIFEVPYDFKYEGDYFIYLYDTVEAGSGSSYVKNSLVYTSMVLTVCHSGVGDGEGGIEEEDTDFPSGYDREDEIIPDSGLTFEMLAFFVGLGICFILLISPSLISRNWLNKMPKEVNIVSCIIGVIGCSLFGLFPIYTIYILGLLFVIILIGKIHKIMESRN